MTSPGGSGDVHSACPPACTTPTHEPRFGQAGLGLRSALDLGDKLPPSPSDPQLNLDLRKTALLRSLLLRTEARDWRSRLGSPVACLPAAPCRMTQLACASKTGRVCCQSCSASQLEPAKRSLGGSERAGEGCPNARGRHAAAQPHVDAGGPRSSPFGPAATKRRAGARAPRAAAGRQAAPRLAGRPGGHGVVRRGGCHERQQHR